MRRVQALGIAICIQSYFSGEVMIAGNFMVQAGRHDYPELFFRRENPDKGLET
ncbi:MAG: hypothetical protein ACMUIL_08225 [bacterium]